MLKLSPKRNKRDMKISLCVLNVMLDGGLTNGRHAVTGAIPQICGYASAVALISGSMKKQQNYTIPGLRVPGGVIFPLYLVGGSSNGIYKPGGGGLYISNTKAE